MSYDMIFSLEGADAKPPLGSGAIVTRAPLGKDLSHDAFVNSSSAPLEADSRTALLREVEAAIKDPATPSFRGLTALDGSFWMALGLEYGEVYRVILSEPDRKVMYGCTFLHDQSDDPLQITLFPVPAAAAQSFSKLFESFPDEKVATPKTEITEGTRVEDPEDSQDSESGSGSSNAFYWFLFGVVLGGGTAVLIYYLWRQPVIARIECRLEEIRDAIKNVGQRVQRAEKSETAPDQNAAEPATLPPVRDSSRQSAAGESNVHREASQVIEGGQSVAKRPVVEDQQVDQAAGSARSSEARSQNEKRTSPDRAFLQWCRESGDRLQDFRSFLKFFKRRVPGATCTRIFRDRNSRRIIFSEDASQFGYPLEYWYIDWEGERLLFPKPKSSGFVGLREIFCGDGIERISELAGILPAKIVEGEKPSEYHLKQAGRLIAAT